MFAFSNMSNAPLGLFEINCRKNRQQFILQLICQTEKIAALQPIDKTIKNLKEK